ncbi:MAG: hypothetical protein WCK93_07640 [Nitrosomonadales bacterium]
MGLLLTAFGLLIFLVFLIYNRHLMERGRPTGNSLEFDCIVGGVCGIVAGAFIDAGVVLWFHGW